MNKKQKIIKNSHENQPDSKILSPLIYAVSIYLIFFLDLPAFDIRENIHESFNNRLREIISSLPEYSLDCLSDPKWIELYDLAEEIIKYTQYSVCEVPEILSFNDWVELERLEGYFL